MAILETWQKEVDVAAVQNWMAQPQRLAKTTVISLPQKDMRDDAAALFAALTLRCCQLRTLRLSGNSIGDIGAGCLAESLKLLPPLQTLDLSDNSLSALGAIHLAKVFFGGEKPTDGAKAAPRTLDLSRNKLLDHGVAGVARCVPSGAKLPVRLRLRGVSCGSPALPELLAAGAALLGLDVSENPLGQAGAVSTLKATTRKKLRSLSISGIADGHEGALLGSSPRSMGALARPLADCLSHGSLTDLECGQNALGEHACCQVVEALGKSSPVLLRLAMPETGFGLRASGALGQALWPTKGASRLRCLELSDNQLVDVSIELLSNGICRCATLQEVHLCNNDITCRGSAVLASALHAQRRLVASEASGRGVVLLNLAGNPVGNAGAKALAEVAAPQDSRAFQSPWGLELLDLSHTQVGASGRDALSAAVASRLALLDAASRKVLEDQALQEPLLRRFGPHRPSGLRVLGLEGLSGEVSQLEQAAQSRLAELWPQDAEGSSELIDHWQIDDAEECEVELPYKDFSDFSFFEGYFGGPTASQSSGKKPESEEIKGETAATGAEKETSKGPNGKGKMPAAKGPSSAPPKGKGKGAPAKGKGEGKKGGKSRPGADGKGAEPKAGQAPAPFGRRMHWVHPRYQDPDHDTIFGDRNDGAGLDFDADALASLLRGDPNGNKKRTQVKKTEGIKVLDGSRAQNMAIVLSKLPIPSHELCDALLHLNFSAFAVSEDLVELLTAVLPTHEESEKLKAWQETPELLRDIEQKVLPFCFLPRSAARLRLLRLASSHGESCAQLKARCEQLRRAAVEAMSSSELRQLFAVILRIGNYINHGTKNGDAGAARGFAIETLPAITSFKLGNMSTLHFLCVTFRRSQPNFFETLLGTLPHVTFAAREKSAHLKSSIHQFKQELEFAERELHQLESLEGEEPAKESMGALVLELREEVEELNEALDSAFDRCLELQRYFCTEESGSASTPVFENFFQCLQDFVETLRKAWRETEPAKPGARARQPAGKAKVAARRLSAGKAAAARRASLQSKEQTERTADDKALDLPVDAPTSPPRAELWKHLDADVESLLDHIFQNASPSPKAVEHQLSEERVDPEGDSLDVDELIDSIFAD